MARNPFLLSALVIVYKGSPTADLPHNEGELLKRLIGNLWERYQRAVPNAQFEPVEAALTDLAFALTDGDMPVYVTLDYALEYMGERALLNTAVSAKLLETEGDNVRFSHHLIQEYFAALGLLRAGLPTHLTKPQFDRSIRRISRKWDSAMMMLTGIANNPDVIVTNIAEVDPYLALECIVNGASVSSNTHQQTIDRLLNTMRAEGDTRVAVARIMMAFDPQTALTILLEALRDGVWDVRLAAASAFADLNVPVLPGLTQALHDLNDDTREATANALRQLGKSALPTTLQLLRDPNWRVRRGAAWALSELRDKAAVTLLLNGLHADEHLVSAEAALALGRIKDPAAVPSLLDALRHENWRVRKAAAVALGRIGQPAIPGLLIALKDANPSLRRIAVDALGLIRDDSVRPALLDASHDEIAEVRSAAVEALRHFLDVSVAKRLSELLSDTARSRHSKQRICDIAASILETTGIDQDAVDQARKQPPNSKKINAATAGRERLLRDKEEFSAAINDYPDALTNADWVVRRDAVQSLAALDPVVAVPKLLKTLGDEDSQVRIAVVKMLATINNSAAVQGLLLALGDDDYLVCDAATEALKTVGKPPVPGLLDAIHSTNVNVRAAAITIAGHLRDTETTTSIIDCLSDVSKPWLSDQRICDMAATALEKVGTAEALDAVRQWRITFKVPPPSTSKPALTDIRPREILGELLDALHNSDWNRRQDAAKALRDYAKEMHGTQDATLLMRLTQALDDTDWIVRWAAAEALAWIGDKAAVPALVSLLSDKNRTVRVAVIRALLEIGDPSAAGSLMKMLHDKNEMVRETTAEALGHLGDISTVPGLTAALDDPEWFVRLAAAEALGKMQHSSAVQPLITALHDDNNHVRWAAANALARLANEAVVADLIASLEDTGGPYWEDKRVCDIVADALVGIGTSEAINAVDVWRRGQLK
jgi:HEAT repeat protein